MSHPKIPGIIWLDDEIPDLISIPITLHDKMLAGLDLPNIEVPSITIQQHIDLSKLAGVRAWYPKDSEEPASNECLLDVEGMVDFVADLSVESLLAAWIYYKRWTRSKQ